MQPERLMTWPRAQGTETSTMDRAPYATAMHSPSVSTHAQGGMFWERTAGGLYRFSLDRYTRLYTANGASVPALTSKAVGGRREGS